MNLFLWWCVAVLSLVFSSDAVQNDRDDCTLKDDRGLDIPWDRFNKFAMGTIKDTDQPGQQLNGIQMDGVKFIQTKPGDECLNFLDIQVETDSYVRITSKDFSKWTLVSGICDFTLSLDGNLCSNYGTSENLQFSFTVEDVNEMAPAFSSSLYELTIPLPLPAGLNLNGALGVAIQTEDNDFSTKTVKYTMSDDRFLGEPLEKNGPIFPMNLVTKARINSQNEIRFTVTAEDDGNPAMTSTADIVIKPDIANSIPPTPEFTKLVSTIDPADFKVGDAIAQVELKEDLDNIVLTVTPDEFFQAKQSGAIVTVNLIKELATGDESFMTITVNAEISGNPEASGGTVIILKFSTDTPTGTPTDTPKPTDDPNHPTSTPTPEDDDDESDSGLLAATIVLAVSTAVLLILNGYGVYKYIYKPRKSKKGGKLKSVENPTPYMDELKIKVEGKKEEESEEPSVDQEDGNTLTCQVETEEKKESQEEEIKETEEEKFESEARVTDF